jgi:hypothetical protein
MFRRHGLTASLCALPIVCALVLSLSRHQAAYSQTDIRWRADFETAWAESKQSGKPLFVVFR